MSLNSEFGLKELYDVAIKATSKLEVGGRIIEPNETIAAFDKIKLANFDDIVGAVTANGGFDNRARVWWESTKEVNLTFTQGIFSNTQLAVMTNARLITKEPQQAIYFNKREVKESDEDGLITLEEPPVDYFYVYNVKTGEKAEFQAISNASIKVGKPFEMYLLDYQFQYMNGGSSLIIGSQLTNGFVSFTGKTRVKDDITGQDRTGILNIPKLKLMSDISMRLGRESSPIVGKLTAIAVPIGSKGNTKIMELIFLNDDIDEE